MSQGFSRYTTGGSLPARQLDLCCGNADSTELLVAYNRTKTGSWLGLCGNSLTVAVDIMLRKLPDSLLARGITFKQADACDLPFNDRYFAHVHIFGGLHHIRQWPRALAEMARVTATGGSLELTETVDDWPPYRLARNITGRWHDCPVTGRFKSNELIQELREFYTLKRVSYHYRPIVADLLRLYNKEPQWLLRLLARFDHAFNCRQLACHVVVTGMRK